MGTRLREDWKELGVKSVAGWRNKVKDKGWLAYDPREAFVSASAELWSPMLFKFLDGSLQV